MTQEMHTAATLRRPKEYHLFDVPLVSIDLQQYFELIRMGQKWIDSDRNAITIFRSKFMRMVLIALHQGASLYRHLATGMVTIQALEGQIVIDTDEQSILLCKGQILALHEGVQHSVLAKEEAVFLLTITDPVMKM